MQVTSFEYTDSFVIFTLKFKAMKSTRFSTLLIIVMFSAFAKAQSYQSLMLEFLQVNGTQAEYSKAYDDMITMLQNASKDQNIPQEVWSELEANKNGSLAQFNGILTSEYRAIITDKEQLQELVTFFKTPAGAQLAKEPSKMTTTQSEEFNTFKQTAAGKAYFDNLDKINAAKTRTSEYWSSSLFCTTAKALKDKGYSLGMPIGACN